jgi:REP-associated tyrosine transposase
MVEYRRAKSDNPDEIYFITIAIRDRNIARFNGNDFKLIKKCFDATMNNEDGNIEAFVLIPDHIHLLIKQGNIPFSERIRSFKIKSNFEIMGKNKSVWQSRFWEHRIRDGKDFINHVEYIHYNPVKHGYVSSPKDWGYSSFKTFVAEDKYTIDWSSGESLVIPGKKDQ